MENIQEGTVLGIEGEFARVIVQAHSSCDSCGACESTKMVILAYNTLKAKSGQQVRFVMQEGNMMRIAFVLFVLPLISIFAGAFIGYLLSKYANFPRTISMVAAGALFFALSIVNVVLYDKKYKLKPGNFAQIIEIVK